jgi:hypothetical protein
MNQSRLTVTLKCTCEPICLRVQEFIIAPKFCQPKFSIVDGNRHSGLVDDLQLVYADVVELKLLLERLVESAQSRS